MAPQTSMKAASKRPVRSHGGSGYRFEPTALQREQVEIWIGGGLAEEAIASNLGITRPTLRAHFAAEIANGRGKRGAEIIEAMFRSALAGSVSAQKAYLALNVMARAEQTVIEEPDSPRAPRLGKKEEAAQAASTAGHGTEWGDDLGGRIN